MKILFIILLSFSSQIYAFVYYEEGMPDVYKNIVVEDIELLHSLSLLNKNTMTKKIESEFKINIESGKTMFNWLAQRIMFLGYRKEFYPYCQTNVVCQNNRNSSFTHREILDNKKSLLLNDQTLFIDYSKLFAERGLDNHQLMFMGKSSSVLLNPKKQIENPLLINFDQNNLTIKYFQDKNIASKAHRFFRLAQYLTQGYLYELKERKKIEPPKICKGISGNILIYKKEHSFLKLMALLLDLFSQNCVGCNANDKTFLQFYSIFMSYRVNDYDLINYADKRLKKYNDEFKNRRFDLYSIKQIKHNLMDCVAKDIFY